ncbi:host cell division inhibitor Icd-like protein [Escherichia coli]|nr:host cell division inhibitor Icd-like protein [Escherichia coli]
MTYKTKATGGGRQWIHTKLERITNNATFAAGGQCDQSDLVRSKVCNESFFLCSLRNFSRAKAHGANLSDSCSIFLRRLFRAGDNVLVNSLSVIVLSCIAMRRSYSHHGAGDGYSCSLALRRWRRLISPLTAVTINCALLSPSSKFFSKSATTSCGNLAFNCCDLLFVEPVAITESSLSWCDSVYTKKISEKGLKCDSLADRLKTNGAMHQATTPRSGGTHAGRLTTNDSNSIEAAMRNYTTHPQGRDSHNLNKAGVKNQLIATASQGYDLSAPAKSGAGIGVLEMSKAIYDAPASFLSSAFAHIKVMVGWAGASSEAPVPFDAGYANPVQSTASEIGVSCGGNSSLSKEAANMATIPTLVHSQTAFLWRFIIFGASDHQIIHVTAWTEREARNRCPSGCVAVFAARIRQGVCHA